MAELRAAAVLCDMDGTLVDSNALVDRLWNGFANAHDLDADEVRAYAHGRPSRATVGRYLSDPDEIETWLGRIHHQEMTNFDGVHEIAGARAFTGALPAGRWAIVTSALAAPARARVAAAGITLPPLLVGADDVERGKPDPEGYGRAARTLGADPRRCVVLEDTDAGILAGQAAGCTVVVVGDNRSEVTTGLHRVADLTEIRVRVEGPDVVLTVPDAS